MIANIYGRKIDSGHYAVFRGHEQIGEVGRLGPEGTLAWRATVGTWESPEFKTKRLAIEALADHVVAQNGHASPDMSAIAKLVADSEANVDAAIADHIERGRFAYLGWEEVKDRLALTRGLVLDMLNREDVYALSFSQHQALRQVASMVFVAHQEMRAHDGEKV